MKLSQHKFIMALALSGLVHGWLVFGSFDESLQMQSPEMNKELLHLELTEQENLTTPVAEQVPGQLEPSSLADPVLAPSETKASEQGIKRQAEPVARQQPQTVASQLASDSPVEQKPSTAQADHDDALMQLVYQAINRHKRYPYMARRLGQQGKVTINFVMHPDGQVTDLKIIESSRYAVLDRAASEAVSAISPFALAAEFLDVDKVFDIAVDFRLN